jgi:hypothetical protein
MGGLMTILVLEVPSRQLWVVEEGSNLLLGLLAIQVAEDRIRHSNPVVRIRVLHHSTSAKAKAVAVID